MGLRPQAAGEGGVCVVSLLTGSLRRLSPHPSAGGAADTFSPKGRRLLSVLMASPSGEAAARRRLMRAEFAWSPFNGQHPQALPSSVRGRGRGHLLPQGEKAPVSFNGFPFGGSCRPQAADEGKVRVASLLTGNLRRLSPHPSAGGAADTFSPKGRRLLSVRSALIRPCGPPSPDGEGFYASFPFTSATCFITLAFVGPP